MRDVLLQVFANLKANKLRSVLTMFGVLWGVVSVIVLSASGEGFRDGNEKVLRELGQNIVIVRGGRTSKQAGGERAGTRIVLTVDDARAIARESSMVSVVSPEMDRAGITVKSAWNAASLRVNGIEPQYQSIRALDIVDGRGFAAPDNDGARPVAIIGADVAAQLFASRDPIGATIRLNGHPYVVIGRLRKKTQDSSYNGFDNEKVFIPLSSMVRDFPRTDAPAGAISSIIVTPRPDVLARLPVLLETRTGRIDDIEWPLAVELRRVLAKRHRFDPADRDALSTWDTSLETLMFDRLITSMTNFFLIVGVVTLALGGLGVMNIMLVSVRERTREIGLRKALGATGAQIQRQFFLEGCALTGVSGVLGVALAFGLCAAVNALPMPARFSGLLVTWPVGLLAVGILAAIGIATASYPARRASALTPVEALRVEA